MPPPSHLHGFAILDARGRSPDVRSSRPPIVRPRGRGSLPAQSRLEQLAADRPISPEVLAILRSRHDYRAGRSPDPTSNELEAALAAAELRSELIAAEREYIHRLLQEGQITDEARRRIERELDLEEAGIMDLPL